MCAMRWKRLKIAALKIQIQLRSVGFSNTAQPLCHVRSPVGPSTHSSCWSVLCAAPRHCCSPSAFSSPHPNSARVCFLFNSQYLAITACLALMSPMGVLVQQKPRISGSKVDTWALNGQTVLVKCKISGPSCSLWRSGMPHLSTKGLFFSPVIGSLIRIQKLHFSCVALRSHSHIYLRQANTLMSVYSFKLSETTSDIETNLWRRRVYSTRFLFRTRF